MVQNSLLHRNDAPVVIVGGGTAGIALAARIRRKAPHLSLILIDPRKNHDYQPLWTLVGAGVCSKESTRRHMSDLIPDGVRWIPEAVTAFHPEIDSIELTGGQTLSYCALVVCPGIQINWDQIPGLRETLGKNGVCSNYSYDSVDSTWAFIRQFRGGTALFTHPETPIKCGGAPQKIMYLADDTFRRTGARDRTHIHFYSGAASLFAVPKYARALEKVIQRKGIETHFKNRLVKIDGENKMATFESMETGIKKTQHFDLLHVTPPMSAPDVVRKSSLANEAGWVDVDPYTLQHVKYSNVFSAGDASSAPTSKTGAAIRKQAPVLVDNLLAVLEKKPLPARYNGYTSCPLTTGYGRLILAEFDYDLQPQETFPFDQSQERRSLYWMKRYALPQLYWKGMMKGRL